MPQIIKWADTIKAGATYIIPQNGTQYELTVATGRIAIRSSTAKFSGQFNELPVGIQALDLTFTKLELKNLESFDVVFQVIVADGSFRNNQIILQTATNPPVTYPTQSTPTSSKIAINDLTGQKFQDINGNNWLALYRISIIISNLDTGVSLLLQKANSVVANGPAVLLIPPALPVEHNSSGNFVISLGGATINAIVSEIYSAIPSTT